MLEHENSQDLIDDLVTALGQLPGARAFVSQREPSQGGSSLDFIIEAEIGGAALRLAVEAKRTVFPRDVRQVIWQIERYLNAVRDPQYTTVGLLAADTVSPGAREALTEAGIGYFDSDGSLYLPAKGAFVLIDRPPGKRAQRAIGSIFKGQRAQVLHFLLAQPTTWFGVTELASLSGVSTATVSQTLVDLERREWVETRGSGPSKERRLAQPATLLDAWVTDLASRKPPPAVRVYVPGKDVVERFAQACEMLHVPYAFTGMAAAQRYAPFMTAVSQLTCWASPPLLGAALTHVGARDVDEGWNLAILKTEPDASVFKQAQTLDGVRWVSPLQAFLDLQTSGGRAREMAANLRRESLNL